MTNPRRDDWWDGYVWWDRDGIAERKGVERRYEKERGRLLRIQRWGRVGVIGMMVEYWRRYGVHDRE
jgi:hypothetical protein